MRRREHERIVHEKDRAITRLERQNRELLDRLMYAADKPWTLPPAAIPVSEPESDLALVSDPDQLPDY